VTPERSAINGEIPWRYRLAISVALFIAEAGSNGGLPPVQIDDVFFDEAALAKGQFGGLDWGCFG